MCNPILGQMRQKDQECEASLGYPVRPCLIINEYSRNPHRVKGRVRKLCFGDGDRAETGAVSVIEDTLTLGVQSPQGP